MSTRREFLTYASMIALLTPLSRGALAADDAEQASAFSFEHLIEQAQADALKPYVYPNHASAALLAKLDYSAHGQIHFKPEQALFAKGPGPFPVTFFHLGSFFRTPVRMYVLDNTVAREIVYDPAHFDMPADSPAHDLPRNSGFAGFRIQESRLGNQANLAWERNDWVAFLGASYFRAIGELYQYGLSARAIALDVAQAGKAEEFPDFTHIWFEPPKNEHAQSMTLYARLDGPSLCGAYRFVISRTHGVIMDVDCTVFLRHNVRRLGIAPVTSMFWFGEAAKRTAADWRPEVHDSDGLALWTGNGERIWRPLNNPPRTMVSAFSDRQPKGFGLSQRDRNFDHYLDGVNYQRRPSLWVEPLGDWGEGSVQLMENGTDDEIHDNIVAMWVPSAPAEAGNRYDLRYRLHWLADEPYPSSLARCLATRLGKGGQPGRTRPAGTRKFVVEFQGAPLEKLAPSVKPEAVISCSRGELSLVFTEAVPNGVAGHWRAQFDLTVDGNDPVEMRLFLRLDGQPLSETWLYQYHPFRSESTAIGTPWPVDNGPPT